MRLDQEHGATMVEYGLILLLVVAVSVALVAGLGSAVLEMFSDLADRF